MNTALCPESDEVHKYVLVSTSENSDDTKDLHLKCRDCGVEKIARRCYPLGIESAEFSKDSGVSVGPFVLRSVRDD